MIEKLFDWTRRDIVFWEKIRDKGLGNFIVTYGLGISGGLLFLLFGLLTLINWFKQTGGTPITIHRMVSLLVQLIFMALISLVAGVVNSLITWFVEERLYRGYKTRG